MVATPQSIRAAESEGKGHGGRRSRTLMTWLVVLPFFVFIAQFLLGPSVSLVVGAFQDEAGGCTQENVRSLFETQFLGAYKTTIALSGVVGSHAFLGPISRIKSREGRPRDHRRPPGQSRPEPGARRPHRGPLRPAKPPPPLPEGRRGPQDEHAAATRPLD